MPRRIQRQRAKGWRMPPNAIYVGRPTYNGNPYHGDNGERFRDWLEGCRPGEFEEQRARILWSLPLLRGHDLACWCSLDAPCHADVLLELANREPQR